MLKPHPQPRSSLPSTSHFLQTTNLTSSIPSTSSPKRKRGLPSISTIPPTPPRSSPVPDYDRGIDEGIVKDLEDGPNMLLTLNIPGATFLQHSRSASEGKEDGASSPRTKVAYNFQGLRLEDATAGARCGRFELDGPVKRRELVEGWGGDGTFDEGNLAPLTLGQDVVMDGEARGLEEDFDLQIARKKVKMTQLRPKKRIEVPETPQRVSPGACGLGPNAGPGIGRRKEEEKKFGFSIGSERMVDPVIRQKAGGVTLSNSVDEMVFMGHSDNSQTQNIGVSSGHAPYTSVTRPLSKPRKKRAGTPPLTGSLSSLSVSDTSNGLERDPNSLTWHDDEITGHDPTDPDDDGEGINGIGFKPTAAEAYARTQKRRQQMAEYRNREAREARKMRNERRRGAELKDRSREDQGEGERRVRFMEGVEET